VPINKTKAIVNIIELNTTKAKAFANWEWK